MIYEIIHNSILFLNIIVIYVKKKHLTKSNALELKSTLKSVIINNNQVRLVCQIIKLRGDVIYLKYFFIK